MLSKEFITVSVDLAFPALGCNAGTEKPDILGKDLILYHIIPAGEENVQVQGTFFSFYIWPHVFLSS